MSHFDSSVSVISAGDEYRRQEIILILWLPNMATIKRLERLGVAQSCEPKLWLGWPLATARLDGFRLRAKPVATLAITVIWYGFQDEGRAWPWSAWTGP